ncbi:MAG: hypothetical protein WDN69_14925 [Aliidongia sp.]
MRRASVIVATLGVGGTVGADNGHFNQPAGVHLNPASRELFIADYRQ